jgi:hypothetical protein
VAARTRPEAAQQVAEAPYTHAEELCERSGYDGARVYGVSAEDRNTVICFRHQGKLYEGYVVVEGKAEKLVVASGW